MTTKTTPPAAMDRRATKQAGGRTSFSVRQALHVLIAAATWLLFFYWWGIVLPQVRRDEAVSAALLITLSSLATVLLTAVIAALSKDLRRYDFRNHAEVIPRFPAKEPTPGRAGTPIGS